MPKLGVEEERKDRIIQAARVCFARKGYELTTMEDVVTESGISKGGIYYWFSNKRDIFLAILDQWGFDVLDRFQPVRASDLEFFKQLEAVTRIAGELVKEEEELARRYNFDVMGRLFVQFIQQATVDNAVQERLEKIYSGLTNFYTALIDDAVQAGQIRPVDAEAVSFLIVAAYDGTNIRAMADPRNTDRRRLNRVFLDLFRAYLAVERG